MVQYEPNASTLGGMQQRPVHTRIRRRFSSQHAHSDEQNTRDTHAIRRPAVPSGSKYFSFGVSINRSPTIPALSTIANQGVEKAHCSRPTADLVQLAQILKSPADA